MMRFSTFRVVLDPEQPVYIPGQTVQGYVKVDSPKNVTCKRITVTFKGGATVKWKGTERGKEEQYTAQQLFFHHEAIVWSGKGSGNTVKSGEKTFPFFTTLPHDIPDSFASKYGKVIYQVMAEAELPWTINQKRVTFFSVNFMYDLNLDPLATQKLSLNETKKVGFGSISLSMSAERSGYVSGESIVVNGEVVNHSKFTIQYTEIKLLQMVKYSLFNNVKSKEVVRTVQRVYHPELKSGRRDVWSEEPLQVPPVPSSHLKHCELITIDYIFVLKAKVGPGWYVETRAPVIIGSLPLRTTYSTFLPHRNPALSGGATATTTTTSPWPAAANPHSSSFPPPSSAAAQDQDPDSSDPPPYSPSFLPDEYRDVPPPSYACCVFGVEEEEEEEDSVVENDEEENTSEQKFVPRYVTYRTGT